MATITPKAPTRASIKRRLTTAFHVRVHAFLLIVWCGGFGFAASKSLYALGLTNMGLRYGIAVIVTYAAFLCAIRLWLSYIGLGPIFKYDDGLGGTDVKISNSDSGISFFNGVRMPGPIFSGQGGTFDGAGASSNWVNSTKVADTTVAAISAVENEGIFSGFEVTDEDMSSNKDKAIPIMVLLGITILVFSILVGAVYLGTELLVQLAFEMMLAVPIRKSIRRSGLPWITAAFKHSWIALVIVFGIVVFAGTWAQKTFGTQSAGETVHAIFHPNKQSLPAAPR